MNTATGANQGYVQSRGMVQKSSRSRKSRGSKKATRPGKKSPLTNFIQGCTTKQDTIPTSEYSSMHIRLPNSGSFCKDAIGERSFIGTLPYELAHHFS